ncbi:MbnP family protein [Xanthomarina spongicola]|uniref:Copper-binding protein MbnP-like domain-containing protein n=1 Tax=Xanthomarina spongicola TaxID=570520 RepID=A0A316DQ25_9FLAO|nr:MbnP family protein [Xanthomarina spongicola]PWK20337.1 hypothetical protein LX78_00036 [Xanthomarina spongicola]
MKKIIALFSIIFTIVSCSDDDNNTPNNVPQNVNTTFNFTHNWDGTAVSSADFNNIQFTNANGEEMSIEKLRYLISNVTFYKSNGETIVIDGYNLIDVTNDSELTYTPNIDIPTGSYENVSFTFGFNNEDNYNNNYPDLNSALWNVPDMMGGGYHYMQLEGKYINTIDVETGYAYHAIRAVNMSNAPDLLFQDTFFTVNLGPVNITNNISFNIEMNIAEWFKNPNQWDLNVLYNMLMPNFDAQVMIYENGQNVFSLKNISQ